MPAPDFPPTRADLRLRVYTVLAAALAGMAVASAMPADPSAPAHLVLAYADFDRRQPGHDEHSRPPRVLRYEYRGYESRLKTMERRIDEDERFRRSSPELAARHRQDVQAIRGRFHYMDERHRRMSRRERERFEADLRAQETGLYIEYRP